MTVNFATPIAHQTGSDYAAFDNALVVGRPFRQGLITAPNPTDFARGCELFLSSAGSVADVYAWCDATLTWTPGTAAAPGDRLVLALRPNVLSAAGTTSLASVPMLERRPRRAIYENVDRTAVQAALEALLVAAHADAQANPLTAWNWHPTMRMIARHDPAPQSLKDYLDANLPVASTVTRLVTDFLAGAAAALLREIPVQAADRIGRAGPYLAGDPLPATAPFPLGAAGDANRARRLTFVTEDQAGEALDPLYYLHIFMRRMLLPAAQRIVITLTNTVQGGALAHPLVALYPALNGAARPTARAQVNGAHRFPIGDLASWHASPRPPAAVLSAAEWRYTTAGHFEARLRANGAAIPVSITQSHRDKVDDYWNDAALVAVTNRISTELQIPVELVVALACTESLSGLNPRSIRFEPLLRTNRDRLRASPAAAHELEYDKLVGLRATVTAARNDAGPTTRLDVTFAAARALAQDLLATLNFKLLVGDADRLDITANSASAGAVAGYEITVRDATLSGGSPMAGTQAPGETRFYSISARGPGNAAAGPVETAAVRAGRLRRMRITLGQNTMAGATTATVMRNGAATGITAQLAAGATVAVDNARTEDVATGDSIALRVEVAAGGAGQIRNLQCHMQFAPAGAGDVHTLEGYTPPAGVPNPLVGGALVRAGASTLTWDQMAALVDGTGGARVSPGLLQTLISTAIGAVRFLRTLDPGIFGLLGLPAPPATPSQYMTNWLLTAGHSVLVGAAYLRQAYSRWDTRFDLPYVGAAYNGGNTNAAAQTRWGFQNARWNYPEHAAPYFNAAGELFDGVPAPATAPTVRFMS